MRKRLVLGNTLATLLTGVIVLGLAKLGVGALGASLVGVLLLVALTSFHAIRMLNGFLARLSQLEEAVLRASYGEPEVRLGAIEPPFDGIAYRLDTLFAMLDESTESAGGSVLGEGAEESVVVRGQLS